MRIRILGSARVALILVLLVVAAGSIVRSTGSGMGCPDWPKCFGYYIPPSDPQTLLWQDGKVYSEGQMIIRDGALWVCSKDHLSETFPGNMWEQYTVHDYAEFNPFHTWVEYINRLLGALSGLPVLLLVLFSLLSVKRDPLTFLLSLGVLALLGFVAWLGKVVVDSNLTAHKITLHMAGAVAIVSLLIAVIARTGRSERLDPVIQKNGVLLFLTMAFALIQIFLGTQVREGVDELLKSGMERSTLTQHFSSTFFTHRTMAWAVVVLNAALCWKLRKSTVSSFLKFGPMAIVVLEIMSGVVLVYFGMPAAMQPVHLVAAFLLFSLVLYLFLFRIAKNPAKQF